MKVVFRRLSCIFSVFARWRRWGGERGGTLAILLWLHYALPDSFLEGPLCFRPTDWILERLGLLLCLYFPHWRSDSCDRGPGLTFRLHSRSQRLGHRSGVCGPRHFCSRWASVLVVQSYQRPCPMSPLGFSPVAEAAACVTFSSTCAVRGILSKAHALDINKL